MVYLVGLVFGFISLAIGVLGFSQIFGSVEWAKARGPVRTGLTVLIWMAILCGYVALIYFKFHGYFLLVAILIGVSALLSLRHQTI